MGQQTGFQGPWITSPQVPSGMLGIMPGIEQDGGCRMGDGVRGLSDSLGDIMVVESEISLTELV